MADAVTPVTGLAGGAIAGLIAALAMDVQMGRQPDGWTPAFVAVGVLTRTDPDDVSFERASALHHGIGVVAGGLYGALTLALADAVPHLVWQHVPLIAHALAVVVVTLFIYLCFAHVVLPRVGKTVYEERATAIRGQWLRSSLVFAVTMTIAGVPAIVLVATVLDVI